MRIGLFAETLSVWSTIWNNCNQPNNSASQKTFPFSDSPPPPPFCTVLYVSTAQNLLSDDDPAGIQINYIFSCLPVWMDCIFLQRQSRWFLLQMNQNLEAGHALHFHDSAGRSEGSQYEIKDNWTLVSSSAGRWQIEQPPNSACHWARLGERINCPLLRRARISQDPESKSQLFMVSVSCPSQDMWTIFVLVNQMCRRLFFGTEAAWHRAAHPNPVELAWPLWQVITL